MTGVVKRYELRSLGVRLIELERERAEARELARLLLGLQHAFARIAATRAPAQVITQMLRAGYDPLGFSRGIFFSAKRDGIEARWQFDGSESVEPSLEIADFQPHGPILGALRGDIAQSVGYASELSAPLLDTRGWYVLSALALGEGTHGLLYLDGHRNRAPREWETGLVRALATRAAVSLENSLLFERTERLAMRDPLTGVYNRRALSQRLDEEIANGCAPGRGITFVLLDVDDFKRINDAYGHAHGDVVLQRVALALTRNSRAEDVVGRYAGDEFVVLFADLQAHVGRRLVARISADLRAQGLRCSLGAAHFPNDASDALGLLEAADGALYATKAAGKNGYSFAS